MNKMCDSMFWPHLVIGVLLLNSEHSLWTQTREVSFCPLLPTSFNYNILWFTVQTLSKSSFFCLYFSVWKLQRLFLPIWNIELHLSGISLASIIPYPYFSSDSGKWWDFLSFFFFSVHKSFWNTNPRNKKKEGEKTLLTTLSPIVITVLISPHNLGDIFSKFLNSKLCPHVCHF